MEPLVLSMTEAQQGIWFSQQSLADASIYGVAEKISITGRINTDTWLAAAHRVFSRQPALTMTLRDIPGEDLPQIRHSPQSSVPARFRDLSGESDPAAALEREITEALSQPIDLYRSVVSHAVLYRLAEEEFCWFMRVHHLAADGFGFALIGRDLAETYTDMERAGAQDPHLWLEEDRARWAHNRERLLQAHRDLAAGTTAESREYWANQLPTEEIIPLAPARENRVNRRWSAGRFTHRLSPTHLALATGLLAAVLNRKDEAVLGVHMMGRPTRALLEAVCTSQNELPLPVTLQPHETVEAALHRISEQWSAMSSHQMYRHENIRRDRALTGDRPPVEIALNIVPFAQKLTFGSASGFAEPVWDGPADLMTVDVRAIGHREHEVTLLVPEGSMDDDTAQACARLWAHLYRQLLEKKETQTALHSLSLTSQPTEVPAWTRGDPSIFDDIPSRWAEDETVLSAPDGTLTGRRVRARIDGLRALLDRQVPAGGRVLLALPRCSWAALAPVASILSGITFIPADLTWPAERLRTIADDAAVDAVLTVTDTAPGLADALGEIDAPILALDTAEVLRETERPHRQAPVAVQATDPAYILYTSGTTGRPKGVVVEYRNLANYLRTVRDVHLPRARQSARRQGPLRCIHEHSFAFDSALSPLTFFMLGQSLYIPADSVLKDTAAHRDYLTEHRIDLLDISPVILQELLRAGYDLADADAVSGIIIGGDSCPPPLWDLLHRQTNIYAVNSYGPTENTVDATYAVIADHESVTIGGSYPHQFTVITSAWGQECPAHIAGELCLGGASVARGYLNQPGVTAEAFNEGTPWGRIYRTGDLVVKTRRGRIDFLGRTDHQISLNGVRIETAEVEEALGRLPGIRQSYVMLRNDGHGDYLAAYLVGPEAGEDISGLRQLLLHKLPASFVPTAYVALEKLPLTDRGKVDRRRLPAPAYTAGETGRPWADLNASERGVATVFEEVTGYPAEEMTSDTDLFLIGGHSLTATRVLGRLRELGDQRVTLADIFADATVGTLAQYCAGVAGPAQSARGAGDLDDGSLTDAQRRLWFIEQSEGPSPLYTIPVVFDLPSATVPAEFEPALRDAVACHPALSSLYRGGEDGQLRRQQLPRKALDDLVALEEYPFLESDIDFVQTLPLTIDIGSELPLKVCVAGNGHMCKVALIIHHIAADGWALSAFLHTLSEALAARAEGRSLDRARPATIPQPQPASSEDLRWWVDRLRDLPATLDLPSDRPRPHTRDRRGAEVRTLFPAELSAALKKLCRRYRCTEFMLLQVLVSALLTRCGAGDDIPLGTITSSRSTAAEEAAVTFAANTVVTRTDTSDNPTFEQLLDRVRRSTIETLQYSHVPFDLLVTELNPIRSAAHHPLFQVLLVHQNTGELTLRLPGGESVHPRTVGTMSSKFDLTFEFSDVEDEQGDSRIALRLEFATDMFDLDTAGNLSRWILGLARSMAEDPAAGLWDFPLDREAVQVARREARRMLTFRASQKSAERAADQRYDTGRSLTELVEQSLAEHADNIALVDILDDGSRATWTFAQLERESRIIRDRLLRMGIGVGHRVGLLVPRSAYQVIACVGALRAGATSVPLDPQYPLTRLTTIVEDAKVSAILHRDGETLGRLREGALTVPAVDIDSLEMGEDTPPIPAIDADTDAYIIFTSGSTGRPKGVVVPQRNVVRLFASTDHWFRFSSQDRWTMFHSFAFDFAVWEIYGALLTGAELVIVPHSISRSPQDFADLLVAERITVLNQTPSAFGQLVIADETGGPRDYALRCVVLGGEAMDLSVVHRWQRRHRSDRCRVINMYGITETTVHVTYQQVTEDSSGLSPVGEPIPDLAVYLVDRGGHPVPDGVTGEIYVGGAGLAREYFGQPDLSAQRFVPDPFARQAAHSVVDVPCPVEKMRMYRSGDLAVRRGSVLDFRGRADRQVQLRGFRIELGEIEAAAMVLEGVRDSYACLNGDSDRDRRLVLYTVSENAMQVDPVQMRRQLAAVLPPYMVPSHVMAVEAFPLTVNGKLDVSALPQPATKHSDGRAPSGELERQLHSCFTAVLGIESCSAQDSFFDLGGHSMLAVELVARIERETGLSLRVGTLMGAPTIEQLATVLQTSQHGQADLQTLLPLQQTPGPARGALYCIHPAGGLSWCYSSITKYVPADIAVWGVQARGVRDPRQQPASLEVMARDYLSQILRVHPGGPLHIMGWSLGGMVAQVLAAIAEEEGHEVGLVALLDAYPSEAAAQSEQPPFEDAVSSVLAMAGLEDSAVKGDFSAEALVKALTEHASPMAGLPSQTVDALLQTYLNTAKILREYAHPTLHRDMLFFSATRAGVGRDHDPAEWAPYLTGKLHTVGIDCTHREMTQAGPMSVIGPHIVDRMW